MIRKNPSSKKTGESANSSADEEGPQRDAQTANRKPPYSSRSKARPTVSPTKFSLVREQRQLAGEFREFIDYHASSGSNFLTAEESPLASAEEESSGEALTFATPNHDVGQAIRERRARNQRPVLYPAGAEPADNEGSGSDDDQTSRLQCQG